MNSVQQRETQPEPPRAMPNGEPASWIYLDSIPTPPEAQTLADEECREYGFWSRWTRREVVQDRKLMFLFPGKKIAYKKTRRGLLLLLVTTPDSEELQNFRASLTPDQQDEVIFRYIFHGRETPFHNCHCWS